MATLINKLAKYPTRIPQIYGTLVTIALILYFFLIYALGLMYVTELRLVNLIIQVAGIYLAIRQYRNTHHGNVNYLRAMSIGIATAFIASSTFVVFLFAYLKFDQHLMQVVIDHAPLGEYLDPYIASFSVWLEGIFSGVLATFVIVNYVQTDNVNTNKVEE